MRMPVRVVATALLLTLVGPVAATADDTTPGGNLLSPAEGNLLGGEDGNLLGGEDGNLLGGEDGNLLGGEDGNLLGGEDGNLLGGEDGNLLGESADQAGETGMTAVRTVLRTILH